MRQAKFVGALEKTRSKLRMNLERCVDDRTADPLDIALRPLRFLCDLCAEILHASQHDRQLSQNYPRREMAETTWSGFSSVTMWPASGIETSSLPAIDFLNACA